MQLLSNVRENNEQCQDIETCTTVLAQRSECFYILIGRMPASEMERTKEERVSGIERHCEAEKQGEETCTTVLA